MREDMAKVIVERPRHAGWVARNPKGQQKRLRRALESGDGTPVREGIKRPYGHRTKELNEHLGPLRRYLDSQVGRPWDKVFSEICQHIDRSNPVQDHVRDHVADYVVTNVVVIDGELCHGGGGRWGWRYGTPLRSPYQNHAWYVCPRSGLLKRVPPARKAAPDGRPQPPAYVGVGKYLQCRFIAGRWELVTLAPLPQTTTPTWAGRRDVVLDRVLHWSDADRLRQTYGALVYATARRVLSRRELKNYPIPIDFTR